MNIVAMLVELIEQFQINPAQTAARVYYVFSTNSISFKQVSSILTRWVEITAEVPLSIKRKKIYFHELYKFVTFICKENQDTVKLSYIFHNTVNNLSSLDLKNVLLYLNDCTKSPKIFLCQALIYLNLDKINNVYESLLSAFAKETAKETISLLLCCSEDCISNLRNMLVKARREKPLLCTCSKKGCTSLSFVNIFTSTDNFNQEHTTVLESKDSLQVCDLHRLIADLNDIVVVMRSRDIKTVFFKYTKAERYEVAYHLMMSFSNMACLRSLDLSTEEQNKFEELDSFYRNN